MNIQNSRIKELKLINAAITVMNESLTMRVPI